jgi:hypothetical protein
MLRTLQRCAFGVSAIFVAAVALAFRDGSGWIELALAVAQLAGGAAMMRARTARVGLPLLAAVYAISTLLALPAVFAAPRDFGSYYGAFETLALLCGALSLWMPAVARIGLGLCAAYYGFGQVVYFARTLSLVPPWIPPGARIWVDVTTLAFWLAALAMVTGVRAREAMRATALMLAAFGALVWIPVLARDPHSAFHWNECAMTLAIAASFWYASSAPKRA